MSQTEIHDVVMSIKKALISETVAGPSQFAKLDPEFFKKVKTSFSSIDQNDLSNAVSIFRNLIDKRLLKIQRFATFGDMTAEMSECLTPEEREFFTLVSKSCSDFKGNIMVNQNV